MADPALSGQTYSRKVGMALLEEQTTPESSQVETSQVSEQETAVTEDQTEDGEVVETEQAEITPDSENKDETTPEDEGQKQNKEQHKPTRYERRLQQVYEKGKQENPLAKLLNSMPEPQPDENGFYSPEQVRQMAAVEAARAIQLDRDVQEYRQETDNFVSEIEEVGEEILNDFKDNPQLAERVNKILTKQLKSANVRIDQQGREFLVPTQKPRQLYKEIKEALDLTNSQGTEQATAELAKQIAEGAVAPTAGRGGSTSTLASLKKDIWNNPGKVAADLAARLPRSSD